MKGRERAVPEWMRSQLKRWREEALATDAKERQVRRELEKMVSIELPIGVGALSWITLQLDSTTSKDPISVPAWALNRPAAGTL